MPPRFHGRRFVDRQPVFAAADRDDARRVDDATHPGGEGRGHHVARSDDVDGVHEPRVARAVTDDSRDVEHDVDATHRGGDRGAVGHVAVNTLDVEPGQPRGRRRRAAQGSDHESTFHEQPRQLGADESGRSGHQCELGSGRHGDTSAAERERRKDAPVMPPSPSPPATPEPTKSGGFGKIPSLHPRRSELSSRPFGRIDFRPFHSPY
jgi:hypothetical protein